MGNEKTIVQGRMEVAGIVGPLWVMGWLFTIGYCHLAVPRLLYAIVIWPYYLGGEARLIAQGGEDSPRVAPVPPRLPRADRPTLKDGGPAAFLNSG